MFGRTDHAMTAPSDSKPAEISRGATIREAMKQGFFGRCPNCGKGRMFRAFADQTRSDRRALAACIRGSRQVLTREQAASIRAPTLIAVGTKDPIAGSAEELAAAMPNARALPIPGRDHMLAVGDKVFKAGVLQFLEEHA